MFRNKLNKQRLGSKLLKISLFRNNLVYFEYFLPIQVYLRNKNYCKLKMTIGGDRLSFVMIFRNVVQLKQTIHKDAEAFVDFNPIKQ